MAVNAWVFSGGEFRPKDLNLQLVADTDLVVGVDHGITHCLAAGLVPDVLMGDFDSVDEAVLNDIRLTGVKRIAYPSRKNRSDLELALDWLAQKPVAKVTLLGISGGRSDHHLFNWLLPLQGCWNFVVELIDASVHAFVVSEQYPLHTATVIGQTISILPMPDATGVSTQGLEYPLVEASLNAGSTLGLSNIAAADVVNVSILSGRLLVFLVKTDNTPIIV